MVTLLTSFAARFFFFLPSSVALIQPIQSSVFKRSSASQTPIQEVTRDCFPPPRPPAQLLHIRTRLGSPLWALITPLQSDDAEVIFCRKLENTRAIFKRAASQSSRKRAAPFPPSEAPRDKVVPCRASVAALAASRCACMGLNNYVCSR